MRQNYQRVMLQARPGLPSREPSQGRGSRKGPRTTPPPPERPPPGHPCPHLELQAPGVDLASAPHPQRRVVLPWSVLPLPPPLPRPWVLHRRTLTLAAYQGEDATQIMGMMAMHMYTSLEKWRGMSRLRTSKGVSLCHCPRQHRRWLRDTGESCQKRSNRRRWAHDRRRLGLQPPPLGPTTAAGWAYNRRRLGLQPPPVGPTTATGGPATTNLALLPCRRPIAAAPSMGANPVNRRQTVGGPPNPRAFARGAIRLALCCAVTSKRAVERSPFEGMPPPSLLPRAQRRRSPRRTRTKRRGHRRTPPRQVCRGPCCAAPRTRPSRFGVTCTAASTRCAARS